MPNSLKAVKAHQLFNKEEHQNIKNIMDLFNGRLMEVIQYEKDNRNKRIIYRDNKYGKL